MRHRGGRHLKAGLESEEGFLQCLRPAAAACSRSWCDGGGLAPLRLCLPLWLPLPLMLAKEVSAKERLNRGLEHECLQLCHQIQLTGGGPAAQACQQQVQQAGGVAGQLRWDQLMLQSLQNEKAGRGQGHIIFISATGEVTSIVACAPD